MTAHEVITDFLLARIAGEPLPQRIALYRALAVEAQDRLVREGCTALADYHELARRRTEEGQLALPLGSRRRKKRRQIS